MRPTPATIFKACAAIAAGLFIASAPIAIAGETAEVRTADYFPLDGARPAVYVKTTRGAWRSERTERLTRTPKATRVVDSEGEYQDYALKDDAPAMEGQSMTAQGFVQRYEPALQLFPAIAKTGELARFRSTVQHTSGGRTTVGSVTREVVLEGVEDIDTPAGHFAGCLRFRVKQENRPDDSGSFVARSTETVWLARGVGEVKSVSDFALVTLGIPWLRAKITLVLESMGEEAPARKGEWF